MWRHYNPEQSISNEDIPRFATLSRRKATWNFIATGAAGAVTASGFALLLTTPGTDGEMSLSSCIEHPIGGGVVALLGGMAIAIFFEKGIGHREDYNAAIVISEQLTNPPSDQDTANI